MSAFEILRVLLNLALQYRQPIRRRAREAARFRNERRHGVGTFPLDNGFEL